MKDARPETWAYGLRNPWRIHCRPEDRRSMGRQQWAGFLGAGLSRRRAGTITAGASWKGATRFISTAKPARPVVKPAAEHSHSEARSLTGGVVYHGEKLPELPGRTSYGDHSTGKIWAMSTTAKSPGTRIAGRHPV